MALIGKADIIRALGRLGQLAVEQGHKVEVVIVGGALMVLAYDARPSTRDVDVAIIDPHAAGYVRSLAVRVASEFGWPEDWLNDGAKGYLVGLSSGPVIFAAAGIEALSPSLAQLLAMKLSAWRDDVDVADARRLLQEMPADRDREQIWQSVSPYLVPGSELKAEYAFSDLWEDIHGGT